MLKVNHKNTVKQLVFIQMFNLGHKQAWFLLYLREVGSKIDNPVKRVTKNTRGSSNCENKWVGV